MIKPSLFVSFPFFLLFSSFLSSAAEPWDQPFANDTAAAVKRSGEFPAPDDASVHLLLDEHRISIDSMNRTRILWRRVYRVLAEDAVDDWGSVEQSYQPWRGQKPLIRARVLTKSGALHWLDPKTIADAPEAQFDNTIFSDTRVVRAPLPAIAVGSLVEVEIESTLGPAFPEAGIGHRIQAADNPPLERFRIVLDAANGAALRTAMREIPDAAVRKTSNKNSVHLEIDLGPFRPRKRYDYNLPSDQSLFPLFSFSTGPSWQALATRYAEIVERQIQSAKVDSLIGTPNKNETPLAIAGRLITELHRNVRYTGVEFSEAAIIPARPAEVLERKFGDCKDKSALLVAMLRAAGLKAHVALLQAGSGPDVDPETPTIDLFNHAIVYVEGSEPIWIDATSNHARIGTIPTGDQGRYALIASSGTTRLLKVPEQQGSLTRHTYDIRFQDFGPGSITETMESNGPDEMYMRSAYAANENPKPALEKYVKSSFAAKKLGAFEVSGKDDLTVAARVKVEGLESGQVMTLPDTAQVLLSAAGVMGELPYEVRQELKPEDGAIKRERDYVFDQAQTVEHVYRLHPPQLYRASNVPSSATLPLGPLQLSRSYKKEDGGVIEVRYSLVIPKRRITPAEFEAMRADYKKYSAQFSDRMTFVPQTAELLVTGQTTKAIALMRESVAKDPKNVGIHLQLSRSLLSAGLGIPARQEAEAATRLGPDSAQAWHTYAWALQHDSFGRLRRGDWDRAGALKALRKAVALDGEDLLAKTDLAIILEFNSYGERYRSSEQDLNESIAIYRALVEKQANPVLQLNLATALLHMGKFDEAALEVRKCGESERILNEAVLQTVKDGAGSAIVTLQGSVPNPTTRAQLLTNASITMIRLRRYADAVLFVQAASRAGNMPQAAEMVQFVSKFKRYEDAKYPDSDPRSVVQAMLQLIISRRPGIADDIRSLFVHVSADEPVDQEMEVLRQELYSGFWQLTQLGLVSENFVDLVAATVSLESEGSDQHGYRISGSGVASAMPSVFVVKTESGFKILGSGNSTEQIGRKVLRLLNEKKIADAQRLLDLVVPHLKDGNDGWMAAARGLWSGTGPANARDIRLTAASLIGRSDGSKDAVEMLKAGYPLAKTSVDRGQLDLAVCEAHAKAKRWADLVEPARRLLTSKTYDGAGYQYLLRSYQERKDWKGLETVALELTKGKVSPQDAWQYVAIARMMSGNFTGASEALATLQKTAPAATSRELQAWNQLLAGKVTEDTLSTVGATTDRMSNPQNPYLVALVTIALQKTEAGQEALRQAMRNGDTEALDARGWVAYGLICKQYGFPEAAAVAWSRARAAKSLNREAQWALALADPPKQ